MTENAAPTPETDDLSGMEQMGGFTALLKQAADSEGRFNATAYDIAAELDKCKDALERMERERDKAQARVWQNDAMRIGEKLAAVGPKGYYSFTSDEWFRWALDRIETIMNERTRAEAALAQARSAFARWEARALLAEAQLKDVLWLIDRDAARREKP